MKLVIRRDQDKGWLGGISFVLNARVLLSPAEAELVQKYKAHKQVLFKDSRREYTMQDLVNGISDKCKDVTVLLENEQVYKDACKHLKTLLEVMASFGGEEVTEF